MTIGRHKLTCEIGTGIYVQHVNIGMHAYIHTHTIKYTVYYSINSIIYAYQCMCTYASNFILFIVGMRCHHLLVESLVILVVVIIT